MATRTKQSNNKITPNKTTKTTPKKQIKKDPYEYDRLGQVIDLVVGISSLFNFNDLKDMIKRKAKANYKRREERTLEVNRRYEAMMAEKDRVNTIKYKKVKAYMDDYNEKHPDKPINLYHAAFDTIPAVYECKWFLNWCVQKNLVEK